MTPFPLIGIVGSAGTYGRWLRGFFERRMGLRVIGHDPGLDDLVRRQSETAFATRLQTDKSSNVRIVDEALVGGDVHAPVSGIHAQAYLSVSGKRCWRSVK